MVIKTKEEALADYSTAYLAHLRDEEVRRHKGHVPEGSGWNSPMKEVFGSTKKGGI